MLVIYGVTINQDKKVRFALPELFGIGLALSFKICRELGISNKLKVKDLTGGLQSELVEKIKDNYSLETNLREEIKGNIERYISNGSIRGFRHKNRLPVRGQRTQSNGKTPRRVIMGFPVKN